MEVLIGVYHGPCLFETQKFSVLAKPRSSDRAGHPLTKKPSTLTTFWPCPESTRPGQRLRKKLWKATMPLMGKSTISTGPFSIANCYFTRGYIPLKSPFCWLNTIKPPFFTTIFLWFSTMKNHDFLQEDPLKRPWAS